MAVTIKGGRITTDDRGRNQPRDLTSEQEERAQAAQVFAKQLNKNPNVGRFAARNITGTTLADLIAAGAGGKYGGETFRDPKGRELRDTRTEGYGTRLQNTLDAIQNQKTMFEDMRMYDPFPDPTGGYAARGQPTSSIPERTFLGDDAYESFFGPRNFLEKGIGSLSEFAARMQGMPLYNEDGTLSDYSITPRPSETSNSHLYLK